MIIGCEKEVNTPLVPGGAIISDKTQLLIQSDDLDHVSIGTSSKFYDRQTPITDFGTRTKGVMQHENQKFSTLSNVIKK